MNSRCVRLLCECLGYSSLVLIEQALIALEQVLSVGSQGATQPYGLLAFYYAAEEEENPVALAMEECGGADVLETLLQHENAEIGLMFLCCVFI